MNKMIEALLIERQGYERKGLKDRVKAVDVVLRELGFEQGSVEVAAVEPEERAVVKKAARKRKV